MSALSSAHFSFERNVGRGLSCHCVLRPRTKEAGRLSETAIRDLTLNVLPYFRDAVKDGFRMVVEAPLPCVVPEVHILSGKGVAPVSPQDWRTPKDKIRRRLYMGIDGHILIRKREAFGVGSVDPKSQIHFLMLTLKCFEDLWGLPTETWIELFQGAQQILKTLGAQGQQARYVVETGEGYQRYPGPYLEIMAAKSLPSFFPQDYGFKVNGEGVIEAPNGSQPHKEMITMIEKRRCSENGSCREATGSLDQAILQGLTRLL